MPIELFCFKKGWWSRRGWSKRCWKRPGSACLWGVGCERLKVCGFELPEDAE